MKKYLDIFWNWVVGIDVNKDGKGDLGQISNEVKSRAKRVKQEVGDVSKALKNVAKQSKDVIDAAAGKKKKGRPRKS